jgi:hypothetical protein
MWARADGQDVRVSFNFALQALDSDSGEKGNQVYPEVNPQSAVAF